MEIPMRVSNMHEAKTHLSRLVERAAQGEEIIIAKAGKPLARLVAYTPKLKPRVLGIWKGKVKIAEDFDELPKELAAAFRGEKR
jgi:prevent-host-death family protein